MSDVQEFTFEPYSDDVLCVYVDGVASEEFDAIGEGARVRLTSPEGESLIVGAAFGGSTGHNMDWDMWVKSGNGNPSWPIRFHDRDDFVGDPAVTITVPYGTDYEELT